ncbi:MAG: hypothetical protein HY051_01905 [Candidatus Aenigmarchaeota archaeon]|nr:hypothetical protein [Candidatus Aenigmarchaeota archaeon]
MVKMVKYIDQSLKTKPWVKTFAIIDPQDQRAVYSWGRNTGNALYHAECLMDPSNKWTNKTGAWHIGVFSDDEKSELNMAFARNVGGYTVLVEADIQDGDFEMMKKGAKSLAHAAKRALKSSGLYHALYHQC